MKVSLKSIVQIRKIISQSTRRYRYFHHKSYSNSNNPVWILTYFRDRGWTHLSIGVRSWCLSWREHNGTMGRRGSCSYLHTKKACTTLNLTRSFFRLDMSTIYSTEIYGPFSLLFVYRYIKVRNDTCSFIWHLMYNTISSTTLVRIGAIAFTDSFNRLSWRRDYFILILRNLDIVTRTY